MTYNSDRNILEKGVVFVTQISISELKTNTGKYVTMANDQDIFITKNGKIVDKLVTAKVDKKATLDHLLGLFPQGLDVDLEQELEERISKKCK